MKSLQSFFIIVFVFVIIDGCYKARHQDSGLLIAPEKLSANSLETSSGVEAKFVKTKGKNALQFICDGKTRAPFVIIYDKTRSWKLSRYHYLAADITNPGKDSVLVEIRLDANGWLNQGIGDSFRSYQNYPD